MGAVNVCVHFNRSIQYYYLILKNMFAHIKRRPSLNITNTSSGCV